MGNSSSAHGRLVAAVSNDDDVFIKQFMFATDEAERNKVLGAKAGWASKTALHLCAKGGRLRVLTELLAPLVAAVTAEMESGAYPGTAARLLSRLVNKQQREGRTPFLTACYHGHWQCAEQLLEAGSNVFAVDKDGNSALHLAAINSHAAVAEQLLAVADHQAITSRLAGIVNLSGFTPLHYAAWVGAAQAARYLLAAGVDPLQGSWGEYDKWLVVPLGSTALHVAALQLQPDICMVLLQHYALQMQDWLPGDTVPVDPRTRVNRQGQTPYHAALWKGLDASSQLALLLNPNVDVSSLFSLQQVNQHRKIGPPALRIIASAAVKQHLLQQLTLLEDQQQQQLQDRDMQLHQQSKQRRHHFGHEQQQPPPGHHPPWGLHSSDIASSSWPGFATEAAASDEALAASAAAAFAGRNVMSEPGFGISPTAGPSAAADDDSSSQAGVVQRLKQHPQEQQHHLAAAATTSRAGLGEIEACDEQPTTVVTAVPAASAEQQPGRYNVLFVAKQQHNMPHSILAPMLAPGSLARRSHNHLDSSHKGRLSHSSSFQRLSSFNSSRHSGAGSILSAAGPSAANELVLGEAANYYARAASKGAGSLGRLSLRQSLRPSSRSSSWSRDLLSGAAAAAAAGGERSTHPDSSDSAESAVFGASTECVAHILRETGLDPGTLSYRHLTTHSRTGSMTAATSLAGALPGCISERLGHCLQGDVLASFSGTCGLVVGMSPKFGSGGLIVPSSTHGTAGSPAEGSGNASPENVAASSAAHETFSLGHSSCSTPAGVVVCTAAQGGAAQQSFCGSLYAEECGVCLDRAPAVLLAACDHALCLECAKCIASESVGCRAPLCPFCRTSITGFGIMPLPVVHAPAAALASSSLGRLRHSFIKVTPGQGRSVGHSLLSPRTSAAAAANVAPNSSSADLSDDAERGKPADSMTLRHPICWFPSVMLLYMLTQIPLGGLPQHLTSLLLGLSRTGHVMLACQLLRCTVCSPLVQTQLYVRQRVYFHEATARHTMASYARCTVNINKVSLCVWMAPLCSCLVAPFSRLLIALVAESAVQA